MVEKLARIGLVPSPIDRYNVSQDDTLFAVAWADLDKEPLVLLGPDTDTLRMA